MVFTYALANPITKGIPIIQQEGSYGEQTMVELGDMHNATSRNRGTDDTSRNELHDTGRCK